MVTSWDETTRMFTFEYFGDAEPLNQDPLIEFVDYTITVIAKTGLSRPVTVFAPFTLRA